MHDSERRRPDRATASRHRSAYEQGLPQPFIAGAADDPLPGGPPTEPRPAATEPSEDAHGTEKKLPPGATETPKQTERPITIARECDARIVGPACVCVDQVASYTVASKQCPGGKCENWAIDEPAIATIIHETGCEVRVQIHSEGVFVLSCDYVVHGVKLPVEMEAHAYDVRHVLGGTDDVEVVTAPLVQSHPFVRIATPPATDDGGCLASSYFEVHGGKLEDGLRRFLDDEIELSEFVRDYFEVELKVAGTIMDFFRETTACRVRVGDAREIVLVKGTDFTDTTFETDLPGESGVHPRVVVLRGLGETVVKVVAENPIGRAGTDWIHVFIRLGDAAEERIARLQRELAILIENAATSPHAGHASAILNKRREIKRAYFDGLKDPCIECWHNDQDAQTFTLTPADQTRTQARDADGGDTRHGTVTAESPGGADTRHTQLERKGATYYLTDRPVEQFWVTKHDYAGSVYDWDPDGMLRGEREFPLRSKDFHCCGDAIPVFGVELETRPCFVIRRGEGVPLKADGRPRDVGGSPGRYRWSVIARPNADAKAEIRPDGWTTSDTATLTVDTSGIYTVKVEYELGGRASSLCYAVGDVAVSFDVAREVEWSICRLGRYVGPLAEHLTRPYYEERQPRRVRGAEVLIRPRGAAAAASTGGTVAATPGMSGPAGPAVAAGGAAVPAAGGPVIGKTFRGSFVIPPELSFAEGLTLRAYFKPYRPDLPPEDYRDYSGPPYVTIDPRKPYEAMVEIVSRKEIHAIHVIHVAYDGITALNGQAVPLHFVFRPPDELRCPDEEAWTWSTAEPTAGGAGASTSPGTSANAGTSVSTTTTTGGRQDLTPLVNLLVYNRDLGRAHASNGFQRLSDAQDAHNLPNGNVVLDIPVLRAAGNGENLQLNFYYNSLQAGYQDSLELMRQLNGLSDADLHRWYCTDPMGRGWTHSYNVYVRPYVKPRDPEGRVLDEYVELVAPDGNRIHFVKESSEAEGSDGGGGADSGAATFRHVHEGDHWLGSAELGHSLELMRGTDAQGRLAYTLRDRRGRIHRFDEAGELTEISAEWIEGSPGVEPLRVTRGGGRLRVRDSRGRELVLPADPPRAGSLEIRTVRSPDGATTHLTYRGGRLAELLVAGRQNWSFEYHDHLGPPGTPVPGSFLRSVRDPRGVFNLYQYYEGGETHRVPEAVARHFWGRLLSVVKGRAPRSREHTWRYQPLDAENQKVVHRVADEVEYVYTFSRAVMAVTTTDYVPQQRDPATLAPTGSPSYEQVLTGALASLPLRRYASIGYHGATKLIETETDFHGNTTRLMYRPAPSGRGYVLESRQAPDGTVVAYEHDAADRLEKRYNPVSAGATGSVPFTRYRYDARGLLTAVEHPVLAGESAAVTEEWERDPATGRVVRHVDPDGVVWTYGHDDPSRDPEGTGLPTSASVELRRGRAQPRTLRWETAYDVMGRITWTYEPVYGGVTTYEYHPLGATEKVEIQEIPTSIGSTYGMTLRTIYDGLLAMTHRYEGGRSEAWTYDDFGELVAFRDRLGHTTVNERTAAGRIQSVTLPGGHTTRYVTDEIGRVLRIDYPQPDDRTGAAASEAFADVYEYRDADREVIEKRYRVARPGAALDTAELVRTIRKTFEHGRIREIVETHEGSTTRLARRYGYDAWGQVESIEQLDGAQVVRKLVTRRDEWGRPVAVTEHANGRTRTTETVLYPSGLVKEERLPPFATHSPGERATTSYVYDELGRLLEIRDSYSHTVQKVEYHDFGDNGPPAALAGRAARCIEFVQDPSRPAGSGGLVRSRETEYNRRGLPTRVRLGPSAALGWEQTFAYDGMGRMVERTDETGRTERYVLDAADRPTVVTTTFRARRSGIGFAEFDAADAAHVEDREVVTFYDYAPHGGLARMRRRWIDERRSYDALGRVIEIQRRGIGNETLTYDALDRVTRGTLAGDVVSEFSYADAGRTVEARYQNRHGELRTRSTFDWEQKLLEYRYLWNRFYGPGAPIYEEDFTVAFDYDDFGKLARKEYRRGSGELLGFVEYDYNAADLRTGMRYEVRPPGQPPFSGRVDYAYDANLRLVRLDAGGSEAYSFHYNHGGWLKVLGRPQHGVATDVLTNTTRWEHDPAGRPIRMVERAGRDTDDRILSELALSYQPRSPESWERATPWEIHRKHMLPASAPVLRGLTYRRRFAEGAVAGATLDMLTQDVAYDGLGRLHASVTQWRTYPDILTDARYQEVDAIETEAVSYRNYRDHDWSGGPVRAEVEYEVTERRYYGFPDRVYRRIGRRVPPAPAVDPAGFHEETDHDTTVAHPTRRRRVHEQLVGVQAPPVPAEAQDHRRFVHDPLGRLVALGHRTDLRTSAQTGDMRPEPVDPARQSFEFATRVLYGPDGEEILKTMTGNGIPGGRTEVFTLRDGPGTLVEYESASGRINAFDTLPGLNVPLAARTRDWAGISQHGTLYYRWDHRGATLYTTNSEGDVVTDYRYGAPDGARDLFGRTLGPGPIGQTESGRTRLALWSLYQPGGPPVDRLLAQAARLEQRQEQLTSRGHHPTLPSGGRNDYGYSLPYAHIWNTVDLELTPEQIVIQGILDFNRGFWDTMSFGITKTLREAIHYEGNPLVANAYLGGVGVGIVTQLAIGVGAAGMARAGLTGATAFRAARAYLIAGDVLAVGTSSYRLATGQFRPLDAVGFVPAIGWAVSRPVLDSVQLLRRLYRRAGFAYYMARRPPRVHPDPNAPVEMVLYCGFPILMEGDELRRFVQAWDLAGHAADDILTTTQKLREIMEEAYGAAVIAFRDTSRYLPRLRNVRGHPHMSMDEWLALPPARRREATRFGNLLDEEFKARVRAAIADDVFPVELELPRSGPDVYCPTHNVGWDLTTGEAARAHVVRDGGERYYQAYIILDY